MDYRKLEQRLDRAERKIETLLQAYAIMAKGCEAMERITKANAESIDLLHEIIKQRGKG
jgi:hypothetical protein